MPDSVQNIEIRYWNSLRKGDPSSLSWLYNHYFKLLYNYAKKINGDNKAAEDAIHDLFVDLWRFRQNLSATTSVRFYLYRSLRRRLIRNEGVQNPFTAYGIPEDFLQSVPCMEQDIIEKETQSHRINYLQRLLNDLSPRQYEAMVLRFYDELSFEEIGAILNVNEQSARNLVQRGLSQLKQFSKLLLTWVTFLFF